MERLVQKNLSNDTFVRDSLAANLSGKNPAELKKQLDQAKGSAGLSTTVENLNQSGDVASTVFASPATVDLIITRLAENRIFITNERNSNGQEIMRTDEFDKISLQERTLRVRFYIDQEVNRILNTVQSNTPGNSLTKTINNRILDKKKNQTVSKTPVKAVTTTSSRPASTTPRGSTTTSRVTTKVQPKTTKIPSTKF